jgi:hypothetical protein
MEFEAIMLSLGGKGKGLFLFQLLLLYGQPYVVY